MHVLLAEDRQSLQIACKLLAEDWHIDLDVVSNGLEALAQIERRSYDLCIMDLWMPVMNGEEAARLIRKKRYLPILALTADSPVEHPGIFKYVDDFLEKPFEINELHQKILELTVKPIKFYKFGHIIRWHEEKPMNPEYLKKLRELDGEGLTMLKVNQGTLIVRKNVQNKISHEFIGKNSDVVEFLEHSEQPGLVHLYRNKFNLDYSIRVLLPEEFQKMNEEEKEELEKYSTPFLRIEKEQ